MKTNTVIATQSGERLVTSTTEQLRIKASEVEPGDWLLSPRHRVMRRDKPVLSVKRNGKFVVLGLPLHGSLTLAVDQMVDVERVK